MANVEPLRVRNACITKLEKENKYRFGYDGYRIELTPDEAHEFYLRIDKALSTYASDFPSINVKVKSADGEQVFNINREQLLNMFIEMRADEKTGKALWYN